MKSSPEEFQPQGRQVEIKHLIIDDAVKEYDPAGVANYCYILAKEFHRFYHDCRILNAETEEQKNWRLTISKLVADYLKHGMFCLGIEMPDRM